jgi:lysozyme
MKRSCFIFTTCLVFIITAVGQTGPSEFREPWKDITRAFVLDPYEKNDLDCSALAREPRVAGIIHRASIGLRDDTQYSKRKEKCKSLGFRWGSYHLGTSDDAEAQVDFYLKVARPADDEVIALDLEDVSNPRYMNLDNARRFIRLIKERTGRYPLLYVTGSVRDAILQKYGKDSEFANTPLWYVRVRRDISQFFPAEPLWRSYTLWQFASELNCCHKRGRRYVCTSTPAASCPFRTPMPGSKFDMDVNVYYGTVDELRSRWPFTAK